MAIYRLQKQNLEDWEEVDRSASMDAMIADGILRRETGNICRVIDHHGTVIWHAHGVNQGNKKAGE